MSMPKELIEESALNKSIALYKEVVVKEPYQPLSTLLAKLKHIWTSNTTVSLDSPSLQQK